MTYNRIVAYFLFLLVSICSACTNTPDSSKEQTTNTRDTEGSNESALFADVITDNKTLLANCGGAYLLPADENHKFILVSKNDELYIKEENGEVALDRGKLESFRVEGNRIYLKLVDISGELVPRWTLVKHETNGFYLEVFDYNADTDEWTNKTYVKFKG